MTGNTRSKLRIYPLFAVMSSLYIMVFGLVMANKTECLYFLAGTYALLFVYGCRRACLKMIPVLVVCVGIFVGITYAVTRDTASAYIMANRLLSIGIAVIPGMSVRPVDLTRNLTQLKVPRAVTLGMLISLSFAPRLSCEIKQIRVAMKTRGAGSIFRPKIFYRAFLVPFVMQLVNISDTLALSVETRGFTTGKAAFTVYKRVSVRIMDILYLLALAAGGVLTVAL